MTKLKNIFAIAISLMCAMLFINVAPNKVAAATEQNSSQSGFKALQSPSLVEVLDDYIYIYDQQSNCIISRTVQVPQANETAEIQASLEIEGLTNLQKVPPIT